MFQPCVIFSSVFGPIEISIVDTVDVDSHLQFWNIFPMDPAVPF
jgi:hypothetical protein